MGNALLIGKSGAKSEPSLIAFRLGILNALDITLSAKAEKDVLTLGTGAGNSPYLTVRAPYNAAKAMALAARSAGRESELLVPGPTSMDADPVLASAYAEGWALAQRKGAMPVTHVDKQGTEERWVEWARGSGFVDGQGALQGKDGQSALSRLVDLPVVGPVPTWGVALGVAGVFCLGSLIGYFAGRK